MTETDFQNSLNQEIQNLSDVNSVFSGILKVSSTFTPDDLRADAANRLEAFVRAQIGAGSVSRADATAAMESMIDESNLSDADKARLAAARGEKDEARRAKLTGAVFASHQAAAIVETVQTKLRERIENDDTFVYLGNERYTTKQVLTEERAILQTAGDMKKRAGDRAAAERAYDAALEKGYGAFLQFPSSNEVFNTAAENTRTILSFSDLGVLNGPPGTGKSTICQSVVFAMLADDTQALLPPGAKIYATSSNPKAADAIGGDLRDGLLIQDEPKRPAAPAENASDDEKATYARKMEEYDDSVARRDRALYGIAKQMGKKYAAAAGLNYSDANIAGMLGDLQAILAQLEDPKERDRLLKRINKLANRYEDLKKNRQKTEKTPEQQDFDAEKRAADKELFNAYIQETYNHTVALKNQEKIVARSFAETIGDMNAGKVPPGSYVIVDEAGLMGREDMFKLMTAAAKAKTRLLLVGDNLQIPPQEAGHPFDLIVREATVLKNAEGVPLRDANGMTLEDSSCSLTTKKILRQASPEEAKAGIDIRNGVASKNPPRGIYVYANKTYGSGDKAMSFVDSDAKTNDMLVKDYIAYVVKSYAENPDKRPSVVAVTTTQDKADDLNAVLREEMKARGLITPPYLHHGAAEFGNGDEIMFKEMTFFTAKGEIKVNPGETAVCRTDDKNPDVLVLEFKNKTVSINMTDAKQVKALDNVCSSFALPLALAQGMSKDRAFLSLTRGDVLDGPNGLVAFTRHQKQMSAYVSRQAYADIDALAADIVKFPQNMNASNFVAQKSKDVSAAREAAGFRRFRIAKGKFELKQAQRQLSEQKTVRPVLREAMQRKQQIK